MKDPHPDTVEKFYWMFMGVALANLAVCTAGWLFMKLNGIEQINLTIVLRP